MNKLLQRTDINVIGEILHKAWGSEYLSEPKGFAVIPSSINKSLYSYRSIPTDPAPDRRIDQAKGFLTRAVKAVESALMSRALPPLYINDLV